MFHYCAHCNYRSDYRGNVKRHQRIKHKTDNKNEFKKYICSFCEFRTHKKYNLDMHKKNKHWDKNYQQNESQLKTSYMQDYPQSQPAQEVQQQPIYHVEHPLHTQKNEQPMDLNMLEDSIQVFKIFKLLQRMKNK